MTAPIADEELAEWRAYPFALCDLEYDENDPSCLCCDGLLSFGDNQGETPECSACAYDILDRMRTALPRLLDAYEALRKENERLTTIIVRAVEVADMHHALSGSYCLACNMAARAALKEST